MKILILANSGMGLYKFRKELINELIMHNHQITVSIPKDEYFDKLKMLKCDMVPIAIDRRGINPLKEWKLLYSYFKLIRKVNPDVVLTYTIKPNIYGGIVCKILRIRYFVNITGLGTSINDNGFMNKIMMNLYLIGINNASCVFFQNTANRNLFLKKKPDLNTKLLPGSGVNLTDHQYEEYPLNTGEINFLFIGRIMKAKGVDELLEAAAIIREKYTFVKFGLLGYFEEDYKQKIETLSKNNVINYYGQKENVHEYIKKAHAVIHPSHHEGLANVLLEAAATGRPVLAANIPGCIETFYEGISGLGFEAKYTMSLVNAIESFISLPYENKKLMGMRGRKKMEEEFDRRLVIEAYFKEINKIRG